MQAIEGIIAATYTPFGEDGNINPAIIPDYAAFLKKSGVNGVFVNGTTGEGTSLTLVERLSLAEAWIRHQSDNFRVLIHVGHNSLESAKVMARHAAFIGADGIGAFAPHFFKPANVEELIVFNAELAAVAPQVPFYYYHLPSMTGVNFLMSDFLREVGDRIPNLAGIKYTHEDFMDLKLCVEYADRKYTLLQGRDEVLISGLVLGVRAAIGSTYNYIAPLFVQLINAFDRGDYQQAESLQWKAMQLIKVLIDYGGGVKAGKSIMRMVGLELGKPRLPVSGLDLAAERALRSDLEDLKFWDYTLKN